MHDRVCPACYTPHARRGIYCSPKCSKRVHNARARGSTVRPPIHKFDCAQCGTTCVPGENVAAHASKFCGYDCKAKWHHIHSDGHRTQDQRDDQRRQRYIDKLLTLRTCDVGAYRKALRTDPCAYCGDAGEALDHIEPKSSGGQHDWTNSTSSCHLCNSLKGSLPLLSALPWIPVATEYHVMRRALYAS